MPFVRSLLPGLILLLLAGCENRAPTPLTRAPAPPPEIIGGNPRFADEDPTDWGAGPAPWHYPVHGVDVSRWQAGLDFSRLARNHVSFAYIKATEGGDHLDREFSTHWRRATAAGMPRGAYHFFYWCRPASEQARWFLRHLPRGPMLPPVLDVEWNHRSPSCRTRPKPAAVRAEMRDFLARVAAATGRRPIIYTTPDFYAENELWKINGYPFWLRAVAEPPGKVYPGERWLFWQYTGTGRVPGAPGTIDLNVFHGSAEQWRAFFAANGAG